MSPGDPWASNFWLKTVAGTVFAADARGGAARRPYKRIPRPIASQETSVILSILLILDSFRNLRVEAPECDAVTVPPEKRRIPGIWDADELRSSRDLPRFTFLT